MSFAYSMLDLFEVFPAVTRNSVLEIINQILNFLGLIGVLVDTTTAGLGMANGRWDMRNPGGITDNKWKLMKSEYRINSFGAGNDSGPVFCFLKRDVIYYKKVCVGKLSR